MIAASRVEAAAQTDIGLVRKSNQDSFGSDEELGLYVVCDGMGGAAGGDIASKLAVATFLEIARQELNTLGAHNTESTRCAMMRAAAAANRAVLARASYDIVLRGMGTTLVAARLVGESLIVANVGDSRAYLFRSGNVIQITNDHSYVAEQVRRGLMTQDEAERSPLQSIITRAVGTQPDVAADLFEFTLQADDALLLTSDGLTRHVAVDELAAIVSASATSTDSACAQLIQLAKSRGGSDNITCILVRASLQE